MNIHSTMSTNFSFVTSIKGEIVNSSGAFSEYLFFMLCNKVSMDADLDLCGKNLILVE